MHSIVRGTGTPKDRFILHHRNVDFFFSWIGADTMNHLDFVYANMGRRVQQLCVVDFKTSCIQILAKKDNMRKRWFIAVMCVFIGICVSVTHATVMKFAEEAKKKRQDEVLRNTPVPVSILAASTQDAASETAGSKGNKGRAKASSRAEGKENKHPAFAPRQSKDHAKGMLQGGVVEGVHALLSQEDRDIELVYQTPERAFNQTSLAVLFLAHGCSHQATDFFDKSPACASCIGLPIERHIVRQSLQRGFLVVAVSSYDQEGSKCWHSEVDAPRIFAALEYVMQKRSGKEGSAARLPIMAFGASSGGRMVHELALMDLPESLLRSKGSRRLAAVVSQIMPISLEGVDAAYPACILWHMPRDERSAHAISRAVTHLETLKRPVKELKCNPQALYPLFFSDWMPSISQNVSSELVIALEEAKLIGSDGFLKRDPRNTPWRQELKKRVPALEALRIPLKADASGVSELLNVAWAEHEFCAEGLQEALNFMESASSNCSAREAGSKGGVAGGGAQCEPVG